MSTPNPESQGQPDNINPAWKGLLEKLPTALHAVVLPDLKAWDQNFQAKLQEVRTEYEPYKAFKDANLDPELINKSLYLWNEFSNNPEKVIAEAISAYELPYVDPATIQQTPNEDLDEYDMGDNTVDITKNPQFQELAQRLEQLQSGLTEREQQDLLQQQVEQHKSWLDEMQKPDNYGAFDTDYVTALMSQGVDGEEAIKRYQSKFAGTVQVPNQTQEQEAPVIMGGDGTTGSGLPQQGIDFAKMPTNDFNDMVTAALQADAQNNNQG